MVVVVAVVVVHGVYRTSFCRRGVLIVTSKGVRGAHGRGASPAARTAAICSSSISIWRRLSHMFLSLDAASATTLTGCSISSTAPRRSLSTWGTSAILEVTSRRTLVGATARSATTTLVLPSWNVRSRTGAELTLLYEERNVVALNLELSSLGLVVRIGSLKVDESTVLSESQWVLGDK